MLKFLEQIPVVGSVIRNIKMVLICGAIVLATNVVSGFWWHHKGYSSAMAKCDLNSVMRERDEARRDLSVQKGTAEFYKLEADKLRASELARKLSEGEYAITLKPIEGCVAPDVAAGRVRKPRSR